jgi:hypothetical protein
LDPSDPVFSCLALLLPMNPFSRVGLISFMSLAATADPSLGVAPSEPAAGCGDAATITRSPRLP